MGCGWYSSCKDINNYDYFCKDRDEDYCNFDYTAVGACRDTLLKKDDCLMVIPYVNANCAVDDNSIEIENLKKY